MPSRRNDEILNRPRISVAGNAARAGLPTVRGTVRQMPKAVPGETRIESDRIHQGGGRERNQTH
jgi:hypothetical protein